MMRKAFTFIAVLLAVFLCSFPALSRTMTDKAIVDRLGKILDEKGILLSLEEVCVLKKAGFIYQPALSFPVASACSPKSGWDRRAVVSGIVDADRSFAYLFGSYSEAKKQTALLRSILPKVPKHILTPEEEKKFQDDMKTKAGRKAIAKRAVASVKDMLNLSLKDSAGVPFLGAYFYGNFLERLYIASIMSLAACEEGIIETPCALKVDWDSRLVKMVGLFAKEGLIGDSKETAARAKVFRQLSPLSEVCSTNAGVSIANLKKVVEICQRERNRILCARISK